MNWKVLFTDGSYWKGYDIGIFEAIHKALTLSNKEMDEIQTVTQENQ